MISNHMISYTQRQNNPIRDNNFLYNFKFYLVILYPNNLTNAYISLSPRNRVLYIP